MQYFISIWKNIFYQLLWFNFAIVFTSHKILPGLLLRKIRFYQDNFSGLDVPKSSNESPLIFVDVNGIGKTVKIIFAVNLKYLLIWNKSENIKYLLFDSKLESQNEAFMNLAKIRTTYNNWYFVLTLKLTSFFLNLKVEQNINRT